MATSLPVARSSNLFPQRYLCSITTCITPLSFSAATVLHAIARGSRHGFEIIDETGLPSGTVYPALGRLERDGYVRSHWEDPHIAQAEKRPPRRYYRMTAPGVRALNDSVAHYRALKPVGPLARARARD